MRSTVKHKILTAALALASAASGLASSEPAEPAAKPGPLRRFPTKNEGYVHQWIAMPSVSGTELGQGAATDVRGPIHITPRKGRATAIVFLSSWCETCQQLTPDVLKLARRYQKLDVDFHYVFKNDTQDDAEGFMKEFGIPVAVLSTFELQKAYNDPPLPSIYLGDRHGWMASRYLETKAADLATLDDLLKKMTAL